MFREAGYQLGYLDPGSTDDDVCITWFAQTQCSEDIKRHKS